MGHLPACMLVDHRLTSLSPFLGTPQSASRRSAAFRSSTWLTSAFLITFMGRKRATSGGRARSRARLQHARRVLSHHASLLVSLRHVRLFQILTSAAAGAPLEERPALRFLLAVWGRDRAIWRTRSLGNAARSCRSSGCQICRSNSAWAGRSSPKQRCQSPCRGRRAPSSNTRPSGMRSCLPLRLAVVDPPVASKSD